MEHRDQRQESHGVHVCNKCGWPFPNPHPSAKHRRAHKRVCGTIDGFKLVEAEAEASTILTISDDDGDQKSSSPKVLGGSCSDKGADGMKTKSKESEDEVFSDAVAEFSEGVGPNKSMGDALDSVSKSNMAVEAEMNSSQTLNDREVLETAIDGSGKKQENKVDQDLMNLETDFGTPSSSSSIENRKMKISVVPEATINQSETEQETKINQELVNLGTNFRTGDSVVPHNDHMSTTTASDLYPMEPKTIAPLQQERNIDGVENVPQCSLPSSDTRYDEKKHEGFDLCKNLAEIAASSGKMDNGKCEPVPKMEETIEIPTEPTAHNDHMSTTTASDLYPMEPKTIAPLQQERNIDGVENVPQCSLPSSDTRYDEKKHEGFDLCKNLAEIAASSGKMDNGKCEPVPKMEETIEIPTEPTAHNGTLLSIADDDMSIHSETTPSAVVSVVKPIDFTRVTSDAQKELESCSCNNSLETDKIKEGNDNVHLPSVSSDLNVLDRPEALVEDSKDHKDVKLTNCIVQDPHEGVSGLEDNFKDPIPEDSYSTLQAEPFEQASEVASFDSKLVENRESGVKNVLVDVKADCSRNSGQEVKEIPVQEVNATQIEGMLGEHETQDKSPTLSDAAKFGIGSIPSVSFSPEVEPVAPSKNSLDNLSEDVTKVLSNENSAAPTGNQKKLDDNEIGIGGVLLADDENKAAACGRHSEDAVQVHLPVDAHERKDNGVCKKDIFDHLDIAGVEDKKDPSEEKFSTGIDSTPESTTNSRENKCSAVEEEMANESSRKFSGTESTDSKSFDINLVSDTQQSVKEDNHGSAVHVACISEVNADDQSCHVQNSSDVHANKEANLVSVCNESVTGGSDASQDGSVSQLIGDAVRITSETWQDDGVKTDVKPQLTSSLLDASVDANSQTDSLEGNWGSVSVLSTQSDLPAVVDGEVTLQARAELEGTNPKKTEAATERQHSDRSDLFEPPSFMTLVEPNGGGIQNSAASEIQTARNRHQPNPASLQAAWFPSYTHVANDSPGRKKNEAIIAKVTNWSTGKPHTALKNLLDDAALENKQKSSPARKENLASMIQNDETSMKNGAIDKTVDSVTRLKSPASQLGNREIPNEWNSPARYPSDIRRERRKGKPYWAQFVCCSSVH